jgi:hypothetical protein
VALESTTFFSEVYEKIILPLTISTSNTFLVASLLDHPCITPPSGGLPVTPGGLSFEDSSRRRSSLHRHRAWAHVLLSASAPTAFTAPDPRVGAASVVIGKLLLSFGCAAVRAIRRLYPYRTNRSNRHLVMFAWPPERRADLGASSSQLQHGGIRTFFRVWPSFFSSDPIRSRSP